MVSKITKIDSYHESLKQKLVDSRQESNSIKKPNLDLKVINHKLADQEASQIVQWAVETFENLLVMSTSFGIQSAVILHLVTKLFPISPSFA